MRWSDPLMRSLLPLGAAGGRRGGLGIRTAGSFPTERRRAPYARFRGRTPYFPVRVFSIMFLSSSAVTRHCRISSLIAALAWSRFWVCGPRDLIKWLEVWGGGVDRGLTSGRTLSCWPVDQRPRFHHVGGGNS